MNILVTTPMLKTYSAVGNDVEAMFRVLAAEGHRCKVCAEHKFADSVDYAGDGELKRALRDENSVLIYHHSVYWEKGKHFLKNAKCKIVFRYHNITPPSFYTKYNEIHEFACECGREQTEELIRDFPQALWLCNSLYSSEELEGVPAENRFVCPPFNLTEQWTKTEPSEAVLRELGGGGKGEAVNLLFVGRVTPNKGHLFLIDILSSYVKEFGSNVKLRIIGDLDKGLEGYTQELRHKIRMRELEGNVEFIGEVGDAELLAYYKGSDFFVSASEHEGFLVPIAEAQYLRLPIIARACAAVPETLGEGQVLLGDDPSQYAAAIHVLQGSAEYRDFLREKGYNNFKERFSNEKIAEAFIGFMGGMG